MLSSSAVLRVEELSSGHDRGGFNCGELPLDDYLKKTARQHADKGISRTFVLVDEGAPSEILGFFTLAVCEVDSTLLPLDFGKKYPRGRLPGVKLARLAVRQDRQGQGYGGVLLIEGIKRVAAAGELVGSVALFVDAKDERARDFYAHFGFLPLQDRQLELFLPFKSVLQAAAL
jgi:GNAT superfamily N-acetyltransferase